MQVLRLDQEVLVLDLIPARPLRRLSSRISTAIARILIKTSTQMERDPKIVTVRISMILNLMNQMILEAKYGR